MFDEFWEAPAKLLMSRLFPLYHYPAFTGAARRAAHIASAAVNFGSRPRKQRVGKTGWNFGVNTCTAAHALAHTTASVRIATGTCDAGTERRLGQTNNWHTHCVSDSNTAIHQYVKKHWGTSASCQDLQCKMNHRAPSFVSRKFTASRTL
jgi:hypothetical protein